MTARFPALASGHEHWPPMEVARWVDITVARLAAIGVRPGDRVGLLTGNSAAAVVALLALLERGAVACPLSTRDPQALTSLKLELLGARQLFVARISAPAVQAWPCPVAVLEDLVGERPPEPAGTGQGKITAVSDPDRQAGVIICTSGSGGVPKAVLHRRSSLTANAAGANANLPLDAADRWLLSLPLYHVGGLGIVWRCALAGATVVLPAAAIDFAATLASQRITHVSLVPTQLLRLLAAPDGHWADALRAVLLGGAPIPASLTQAAAARGLPLFTSYGLTEMGSQVTATAPGDPPAAWHTAGRVLAHRQLKLAEDGEILVAGDTLAEGFCAAGGMLTPLRGADGWYHTGDRGAWDAEGRLLMVGRIDAMFISGGENIHPELIEAALLGLQDVRQVLVVPVPDATFGQRPVAFVDAAALPTAEQVRAYLAERLPRYMAPLTIHPWPAVAAGGLKPDRAWFTRYAASLCQG